MEPISIRYRITEPEFMIACNGHWSAHRQSSLSNVITGAVAIIVGLALLLFTLWLGIVLTAIGGLLLLITLLRSLLWRRAFREAKKYNNNISIIIKDDSINVECAEGKSDLNWDFFTWYLETPDHVLLYMTKRNFSIIPKNAFQDDGSLQTFLNLVESKLKKIR